MPAVAAKVLRLLSSEDARLADICRLISSDQGLATKVLATCNSAYYGIPQKVKTLNQAIALLGFRTVRNVILVHSLPRKRGARPTFAEAQIWAHSAGAALAARVIAQRTSRCDPEEALLAGLVHDSGRLVLNLIEPERYQPVMEAIYERDGDPIDIEREAFGFDHVDVGTLVLHKWSFPQSTIDAIACHHRPAAECSEVGLVCKAADQLLWLLGVGVREPLEPPAEVPDALGALGFSFGDLEDLKEEIRTRLEQANEFLSAA